MITSKVPIYNMASGTIKKELILTRGQASNYHPNISSGNVSYEKMGKLVVAKIALNLSNPFPANSSDIVAYGLPIPSSDIVISALSDANTNIRLLLNGSGNLLTYYSSTPIITDIFGEIVYFTN